MEIARNISPAPSATPQQDPSLKSEETPPAKDKDKPPDKRLTALARRIQVPPQALHKTLRSELKRALEMGSLGSLASSDTLIKRLARQLGVDPSVLRSALNETEASASTTYA